MARTFDRKICVGGTTHTTTPHLSKISTNQLRSTYYWYYALCGVRVLGFFCVELLNFKSRGCHVFLFFFFTFSFFDFLSPPNLNRQIMKWSMKWIFFFSCFFFCFHTVLMSNVKLWKIIHILKQWTDCPQTLKG